MPYELAKEIKKRLQDDLGAWKLPLPEDQEEAFGPVGVFIAGFPYKGADQRTAPYVMIQPLGGEMDETDRPHLFVDDNRIGLVCGIFSQDEVLPAEVGHHILINLITVCKISLTQPGGLADRYELVYPVTWELQDIEEDKNDYRKRPYYVGVIETTWRELRVRSRLAQEEREAIYGTGNPGV